MVNDRDVTTVTYIPATITTPAFESGGELCAGPGYLVSVARRTAGGEVEIHDFETDTFHVLEGSATLVIGGTVTGLRTTAPGQHRGTSIEGGETYTLHQNDVIVIPAGIPHWFKDVAGVVRYYVVKVIAVPDQRPS